MTDPAVEALLRPLSARSLIASALLGTHPPRLSGRLLVAMAERFGISGGTARVALSRMVDRGELVNDDATYELAGALLERQERQDRGREAPTPEWDGRWEQAVVIAIGRPASERAALRKHLVALGLGERREGIWMRPANVDPARQPAARAATAADVEWYSIEPLAVDEARSLVAELFDLDEWAATARSLCRSLVDAEQRLATEDDAVVTGFTLAAAALRHLGHDPRLPTELHPAGWPADELRRAYSHYERSYQQLLRAFFRAAG